jgi:hypothetical protein
MEVVGPSSRGPAFDTKIALTGVPVQAFLLLRRLTPEGMRGGVEFDMRNQEPCNQDRRNLDANLKSTR